MSEARLDIRALSQEVIDSLSASVKDIEQQKKGVELLYEHIVRAIGTAAAAGNEPSGETAGTEQSSDTEESIGNR